MKLNSTVWNWYHDISDWSLLSFAIYIYEIILKFAFHLPLGQLNLSHCQNCFEWKIPFLPLFSKPQGSWHWTPFLWNLQTVISDEYAGYISTQVSQNALTAVLTYYMVININWYQCYPLGSVEKLISELIGNYIHGTWYRQHVCYKVSIWT